MTRVFFDDDILKMVEGEPNAGLTVRNCVITVISMGMMVHGLEKEFWVDVLYGAEEKLQINYHDEGEPGPALTELTLNEFARLAGFRYRRDKWRPAA